VFYLCADVHKRTVDAIMDNHAERLSDFFLFVYSQKKADQC